MLWIGVLGGAGKMALAQTVTITDQGAISRDIVASNDQTLSLEGEGRTKIIAGNNNKVQIHGDCLSLKILGNSNSVEVDRVGNIQLVGNSNHVSYISAIEGESPAIANIGRDNEAVRVSALGSPAPSPTVSAVVENAGDIQVVVTTNDTSTHTVQKPRLRLVGSNNSVVFNGVAQELEIDGSNNDVEIDQVSKVVFHGSNNDVTYKQDLSSGEVVSEAHGSNNDVEKGD